MTEPTPEAIEAVAEAIHYAHCAEPLAHDGCEWMPDDHTSALAALTFLTEHPEHLPGARQDTAYGVPVGDTGLIMATYDGTARKFTHWVFQTPWKESA